LQGWELDEGRRNLCFPILEGREDRLEILGQFSPQGEADSDRRISLAHRQQRLDGQGSNNAHASCAVSPAIMPNVLTAYEAGEYGCHQADPRRVIATNSERREAGLTYQTI
jgi:hypothetical protein